MFSIVGCSSQDRDCGNSPDPTPTISPSPSPTEVAKVNLHYNLTTMPQNCQLYYISCLQLNEVQKSYVKTRDTTGAEEQIVTLDEVPTTTDTIQILYKESEVYKGSEDGEPVASSLIENVKLEPDETKDFYQDVDFEITPVEPIREEITVNLTNCYARLSDVEQIKAEVTVNDEKVPLEGVAYSAEGAYALTVPAVMAAEYKVASVVLYDDQGVPFEWIDPAEPVLAADKQVSFDVSENVFAGGSGTEADPYLVANPRQLDNVRNHLTENLYYQQIKNIDFAGSCGGTLEPGTDTIVAYQSNGDANARFKGDAEAKTYGWAPIGGYNEDVADYDYFTGTYNGGGCTIAGLVTDYQGKTGEHGYLNGNGIGFFGAAKNATFKDIALNDCHIIGNIDVGGICGYTVGDTFDKCKVEANLYAYANVGGLLGGNYFSQNAISGCTFNGQVILNAEAALASGETTYNAGGIAGYALPAGTISNCTVEGFIGSTNANCEISSVGGIVGLIYGGEVRDNLVLLQNTNKAEIHGYSSLGGIVGWSVEPLFSLDGCLNLGSITSQIPASADVKCYVGGVLGGVSNGGAEQPTLANGTTSKGKITVAYNATCIGGIMGCCNNAEPDMVKDAMADGKVAAPSGMVESNEGLLRGLYCGSPYVNRL